MPRRDAVQAAFAATPRKAFLPRWQRRFARLDGALDIGWGQTNSQPRTVRAMLELLDVEPGQRVLDVGAGSGWTTALLAHLVGPEGDVVGVEIVPELVDFGRANLAGLDLPQARIEAALPDTLGLPGLAPFDRILVSAEATRMPSSLVEQLVDGGRLVVPVRGVMHEVVRRGASADVVRHGRYAFVPLVGG
ncbi:MAG: methyltransferase domain-containing protein [Nocardioidaceae bacterium]|nr:methyltransferase domain-containing protein [Nocardioidaceae bacterium]